MEKYRQHRYPSRFPTFATIGPKRVSIRIFDVNSKGMRIETSSKAEVNTPILMDILGTKVSGTVRWCHGGFIGVSFMPELLDHQVGALCYAAKGTQPRRFTSLGLQEMR